MAADNCETERKMPKLSGELPQQATNCAYWLQKKKRFCKMTLAKGRKYCGEHEAFDPSQDEDTDNSRIQCPLDGKHTIFKKHLEKHLKVCNARPMEDSPYYVQKNINLGELVIDDVGDIRLSDLSDDEFYGIIKKINEFYTNHIDGKIGTVSLQHKILDHELSKEEYGKETKKHLQQAAALLGLLEDAGQLQDATSFIEYGAGKGQLAFYLAQLLKEKQDSQVVLLDRMSLRHKRDNKIEDRSLVQRIRVDIADFSLEKFDPSHKTQRYVAISKHLCGGATDLALRCIANSLTAPMVSDSQEPRDRPMTEFIMIALCCHHRCDWRSFVGKEFLRQQSVTAREFVIMTKMASWFVCGTGMSRERRRALEEQMATLENATPRTSQTPQQRLSKSEREDVGFKCKRFLDYARLDFLERHGYEASLKYYVDQDVTLENICLIATKTKNKITQIVD